MIEKGVLDRFFNGYLLKKREIWRPFKYVTSGVYRHNKWMESIIFPRTKFEQAYSNLVESMMPTLQYFCWNPLMASARQGGWTIQEKLFNNYFRVRNVYYHAYAQHLHPWGYIDRQRADGYFRRVETMMPGIEMPEWGQQTNRAMNFDHESVIKTFEAYRSINDEHTPSPHHNTPNYFCIQHLANQRFFLGFWGQKLFYNEKPVGNYGPTNVGKFTREDIKVMEGWYSNDRNMINERLKLMSPEEQERFQSQCLRWKKNLDTYFPEFKNIKCETTKHKYLEPNYERNMEDIRDAIYAKKCQEVFGSGKFSQEEIQAIYEYFLGGQENENRLFVVGEDDTYEGTELYHKFIKEFDLPDVFLINKNTAKPPEETFLDRLDKNWNINFATVDTYRKTYNRLMSNYKTSDFNESVNNRYREVRGFITEEVFNLLFREQVQNNFGVSADFNKGESAVVAALKNDNNAFEGLFKLQTETRNAFPIANRSVRNEFLKKIRGYLRNKAFDSTL